MGDSNGDRYTIQMDFPRTYVRKVQRQIDFMKCTPENTTNDVYVHRMARLAHSAPVQNVCVCVCSSLQNNNKFENYSSIHFELSRSIWVIPAHRVPQYAYAVPNNLYSCIFYFIGRFSPNTLPPINHFNF